MVLVALYLLRGVRVYVVSRFRTAFGVLTVQFADTGAETSGVTCILERHGVRTRSTDVTIEDGRVSYELQLRVPPSQSVDEMLAGISTLPNVERTSITGLHEVE